MLGLSLLLLFNLLGLLLAHYLRLPIPGNVLGMVLLTAGLMSGAVKLHWVEPAANFLLRHMMLFFVPYIVLAVPLLSDPAITQHWPTLLIALFGITLLVMAATGWTAQLLAPNKPHPTPIP